MPNTYNFIRHIDSHKHWTIIEKKQKREMQTNQQQIAYKQFYTADYYKHDTFLPLPLKNLVGFPQNKTFLYKST